MALCLEKQGSGKKRKGSGDKVEVRNKEEGFPGSSRPRTVPAFHAQGWKYNNCVRYGSRPADDWSDHLSPSSLVHSNLLTERNRSFLLPQLQPSAFSVSHCNQNRIPFATESNRSFLQRQLQPSAFSVSHSNLNRFPFVNSATNDGALCRACSKRNKYKHHNWLPAGQGLVSGAEFCPDAIIQYTRKGVKQEESLRIKIRNHLLHQQWKIEFRNDDNKQRVRYTSPEGQTYYSLNQVCLDLSRAESENLSPISEHKKPSAHGAIRHSLPPAVNPDGCQSKPKDFSPSDEVVVEPEHCPQAIEDWYTFSHEEKPNGENKRASLREMTLRAKKHLSSVGWKFWYANHSSKKGELRYVSPRGKCFHSLRLACKDSMDAQDTPVDKMVEQQPESEKMSCPSSKYIFRNSSYCGF